MKLSSYFISILFVCLIQPIFIFSQNSKKLEGNWSGELELPGRKLEIIFKISGDSTGEYSAKMDVPMQGAKDLPVNETVVNEDSIILTVAMIMGKYSGELTSDSAIWGTWKQSGMIFPLILKKSNTIIEIKRPQTPNPPFPYLSEVVEYINPESGLKLAGTLTLPKNAKDCPAVILISGSGAQDRDETIFEHKPFLVIADYLTRNGIAVLRVDDRGVGGSEGNIRDVTSEDFAGDVMAGIEFLKTRKEINRDKIGLIGHSEGGIIAPIVANNTSNTAFLVMLAGPGINGEQILYDQGELMNRAAGLSEEQVNQNRNLQKAIFDIILNEKDSVRQIQRLQSAYSNGMYETMTEDQQKAINNRINAVKQGGFVFS